MTWYRQIESITIGPNDAILHDNAQDMFNLITARNLTKIVFTGVHENLCVMGRSWGIETLTKWNISTYVVRDAVDTMYEPMMAPYVTHAEGTALMTAYVEKFWGKTLESYDLIY
jgi:hypothetical protein